MTERLIRLLDEPRREQAWRRHGDGERSTTDRLERLLRDTSVVVLHDRRIPRTRANIDHLAVGPGGVTVIDSEDCAGKVRVERRALIRPPTEHLMIAGSDRTSLVEGVARQIRVVRQVLERLGGPELEVRGCLCVVTGDGLPLLGRLQVRGVAVLRSRACARLASRRGPLTAAEVERVARHLAISLPPAGD